MYYSLDFAANVTYLCMDEIRKRGLQERKIFRKSMPNNGLCIKVFNKQDCTKEDLTYVNIHSVATLMQDALWSSHERIISKKAWRTINYETCTLSKLSSVLTSKSEEFLINILDFLVEVMQYKNINLMDAYNLGDALGKVVLGPSDCDPIMAEKAGHFLTRMIIEHAKVQYYKTQHKKSIRRIDSGFDHSPSRHSFYSESRPLCKSEGTRARAKFYDRTIFKTRWANSDWCDNAVGVQAMFDDAYESTIPEPPVKPWISIFCSTETFSNETDDTFIRIMKEATKPAPLKSADPFAAFYHHQMRWNTNQIFNEFLPQNLITNQSNFVLPESNDRSNPLKKLNHSFSHLKLNIKRYRSRHDLLDESGYSEDTTVFDDSQIVLEEKVSPMKNVMKKMIKIGSITQS